MTFAIITPALIFGAYVERIDFNFLLIFSSFWKLLCYTPLVHRIWGDRILAGGGILGDEGVVDFSGGIVVHKTAGIAQLIIAFCLGPRNNKNTPTITLDL